MPNLTEEQIQLYQAFSRLVPEDQFISSSGTVAIVEAIQGMIDASLLKDKSQSVNNEEPLLKDKTDNLVKRLRDSCYLAFDDGTNDYGSAIEAADRIEKLEAALREIACDQSVSPCTCVNECECSYGIARAALAGEKKDEKK